MQKLYRIAHIAHTGWLMCSIIELMAFLLVNWTIAMCAASLGIPSIFGAGDEAFTKEAQELTVGIETVSVKKGLFPGSGDEYDCDGYRNRNLAAVHMHPERARELIRLELRLH